jgi:hypothetical protein
MHGTTMKTTRQIFPSHHDHGSIKLAIHSLHQLYKIKNKVKVFCHLTVWLTFEPEPITKQSGQSPDNTATLLLKVAATLKPIRLACCLCATGLSAPTKKLRFEPTVWQTPAAICVSIIHFIRQKSYTTVLLKLPFGANKDARVGSGATCMGDTFPEKNVSLLCCVGSGPSVALI